MRQLEAFHATMMAKTITRAAEILCVSQPSVSRLIADLEEDLGFKLFERKKRRIFPTPEAMKFYSALNKIYDKIGSLQKVADSILMEKKSILRISATPALSISFLPKVIKSFLEQDPDTHISINSRSPNRVMEDLLDGRADIAFCNETAELSGIIQEIFIEIECICALPPNHKLAGANVITPGDLIGETLISLEESEGFFWEKHKKMLKNHNVKIVNSFSTQRSFTAYNMVLEGLGISILEPFSANLWRKLGVIIKPIQPAIHYTYTTSYPSGKIRSEQAKKLVQAARKCLKDDPLPFQRN